MAAVAITEDAARRAERLWEEYQQSHDLTEQVGQTAGIDPDTGRIWFGASILDVADQRDADGVHRPLHFVRIGSDTYFRKWGRR